MPTIFRGRDFILKELCRILKIQYCANREHKKILYPNANPLTPDGGMLQAISETGIAALELESWFGYFAPSKTPADILSRLRTELARVIAAPDVVDTFRKAGGRPMSLNADQTRALVQRDVERWTKLIRDADIKAE